MNWFNSEDWDNAFMEGTIPGKEAVEELTAFNDELWEYLFTMTDTVAASEIRRIMEKHFSVIWCKMINAYYKAGTDAAKFDEVTRELNDRKKHKLKNLFWD